MSRPTPHQTLLLILLPMLGTVLCLRLYLHLVRVQHVYPGGYLVHHLFLGILIELPAAFILAFGARHRVVAFLAPVALGVGSGMILDEVTYLVATQSSDRDYVSWVSLGGIDCVCFRGGDRVGGNLLGAAGLRWEILQRLGCLETFFISGSAGNLESNKWDVGPSLGLIAMAEGPMAASSCRIAGSSSPRGTQRTRGSLESNKWVGGTRQSFPAAPLSYVSGRRSRLRWRRLHSWLLRRGARGWRWLPLRVDLRAAWGLEI